MINLEEFLLNNIKDIGSYALVTYNNKTEATWFTKYNFGDGDRFLESPCELYKQTKVGEDIDEFCEQYIEMFIYLEEDVSKEDYINQFIKPMIIDGWLYEIENFQTAPYLPKEVDDIKLISERECLEWMLNNIK